MFTFVPDQASCIEGERLQLNCSLRSKSVNVEWSKLVDDSHMKAKIKEEKNISIKRNGKNHVMTLKYAKPSDSGKYSINAKTIERLITVNVTGNFHLFKIYHKTPLFLQLCLFYNLYTGVYFCINLAFRKQRPCTLRLS